MRYSPFIPAILIAACSSSTAPPTAVIPAIPDSLRSRTAGAYNLYLFVPGECIDTAHLVVTMTTVDGRMESTPTISLAAGRWNRAYFGAWADTVRVECGGWRTRNGLVTAVELIDSMFAGGRDCTIEGSCGG